jgi:hypothetical protein
MKKNKVIFWISTTLIFLFEGLIPALTSRTEMAKEGVRHLGYPDYMSIWLTVFKVAGALVLIFPQVPARVKEWAYACFAVEFLFAFLSHLSVDGPVGQTFFPLMVLGVLILSYFYFHQINRFVVITKE